MQSLWSDCLHTGLDLNYCTCACIVEQLHILWTQIRGAGELNQASWECSSMHILRYYLQPGIIVLDQNDLIIQ